MVIKADIACGIMEAIGNLPPQENFSDFTVIVEGKKFGCHRFILNACSEFFKALFRSGMKETLENTVTVYGITKESFALILKSLYKSEDVLTHENVIELWHATNLLQISLLVSECEKYIIQYMLSPNQYAILYRHAKLLDSECVLSTIRQLMIKDFGPFSYSSSFLELYPEDLQYLVESDDLNVPSEDVVVSAILKWVSHKPNDNESSSETVEQWYVNKTEAKVETASLNGEEGKDKDKQDPVDDSDRFECPINQANTEAKENTEKNWESNSGLLNDEPENWENVPNGTKSELPAGLDDEDTDQNDKPVKEAEKFQSKLNKGEILPEQEPGQMNSSFSVRCVDRQKYLGRLLMASRICLVSPDCIDTLLTEDLVLESKEALAAVRQAVVFQLKSGPSWPPSAIHRAKSDLENVVMYIEGQNIKAFSMRDKKSYSLSQLPEDSAGNISFRVFNNQIFLVRYQSRGFYAGPPFSFAVFVHIAPNNWTQILHNLRTWHTLIPHEGFLYLVAGNKVYRVQHNQLWGLKAPQGVLCELPFNAEQNTLLATASVGKNIILFHGDLSSSGVRVFCFDTQSFRVRQLESLDGPVGKIVSFGDGENTYIISSHGVLLQVAMDLDGDIHFQVMTKLWGFQWDLRGAIAYKKQLFLFGPPLSNTGARESGDPNGLESTQRSFSSSLPGYFDKIEVMNLTTRSECLPVILPKKWMIAKEN